MLIKSPNHIQEVQATCIRYKHPEHKNVHIRMSDSIAQGTTLGLGM